MLVTDDAAVADRVRHLATQAREPVPHYEHIEVGYNYRLSNLLAAFGRAQLADLDRRVERRRAIFDRYVAALGHLPGVGFMPEAPDRPGQPLAHLPHHRRGGRRVRAGRGARAPRVARHRGPAHLEADAPAARVPRLPGPAGRHLGPALRAGPVPARAAARLTEAEQDRVVEGFLAVAERAALRIALSRCTAMRYCAAKPELAGSRRARELTVHDDVAGGGDSTLDRRALIKKIGVAGAVAWTAPVVMDSVLSPAAAQSGPGGRRRQDARRSRRTQRASPA